MKLTIDIDDELYETLSLRNYVPVLRWRHFNVLCSTGEALANIGRRDLDGKLPEGAELPRRNPNESQGQDIILEGDS